MRNYNKLGGCHSLSYFHMLTAQKCNTQKTASARAHTRLVPRDRQQSWKIQKDISYFGNLTSVSALQLCFCLKLTKALETEGFDSSSSSLHNVPDLVLTLLHDPEHLEFIHESVWLQSQCGAYCDKSRPLWCCNAVTAGSSINHPLLGNMQQRYRTQKHKDTEVWRKGRGCECDRHTEGSWGKTRSRVKENLEEFKYQRGNETRSSGSQQG